MCPQIRARGSSQPQPRNPQRPARVWAPARRQHSCEPVAARDRRDLTVPRAAAGCSSRSAALQAFAQAELSNGAETRQSAPARNRRRMGATTAPATAGRTAARATALVVLASCTGRARAPSVDGMGTPSVSQAALDAHYLQRSMAYELPLPLATWHGTHNSFNVDNRSGVFFEHPHNQIYSIDAQLRYLGVRYVEIDVHYIPELRSGDDASRAKVCHQDDDAWGMALVDACSGVGFRDPSSGSTVPGTALSWEFCHAVGLYNFSRRTGCNKFAPTLTEELGTIRSWLQQPGNSDQIVYIYFEDHISHITGGRPVLQTIVDASLPGMVFTTGDLAAFRTRPSVGLHDWPSPSQLLALGKRVIIFNDAEDRGSLEACAGCKPPLQFQMTGEWGWPDLGAFGPESELDPMNCDGRGVDRSTGHLEALQTAAPDTSARAFDRVQGDATGYPLIGRAIEPVQLTAETARRVMACGMWPQFDSLDEDRAAATRWSFSDEDGPEMLRPVVAPATARCAVILGGDDLRWRVVPCYSRNPRRCACRDIGGTGWRLAPPHACDDGDCDDGDGEDCRAACPLHNGVFAAPRTPVEMAQLAAAIAEVGMPPRDQAEREETLWLNAIERCSGCWEYNDYETAPGDKLHCLPPLNLDVNAPRRSCAADDTDALADCKGDGCADATWMGLSSNFATFIFLGLSVAVCVCCGYRRSVYLSQQGNSPLKVRLTAGEDEEGFEMDVYATNTSVSSALGPDSWDLPGGGYSSPSGF